MWEFKRGDTFQHSQLLPVEWPAGTWTAKCRLYDRKTNAYLKVQATLTPVTVDSAPRLLLSLFAAPVDDSAWTNTTTWPVGKLFGDVEFTDSSTNPDYVVSSKDFIVPVVIDRA